MDIIYDIVKFDNGIINAIYSCLGQHKLAKIIEHKLLIIILISYIKNI